MEICRLLLSCLGIRVYVFVRYVHVLVIAHVRLRVCASPQ